MEKFYELLTEDQLMMLLSIKKWMLKKKYTDTPLKKGESIKAIEKVLRKNGKNF